MKKLSKILLQNAVVLENSEMKAIYGGNGSCTWCCTIDEGGTCGDSGSCSTTSDCWTAANFKCSTSEGIRIQCDH